VASQQEPEPVTNTLPLDMDQQLLGKSAGGNSLPNFRLPNVPLPEGCLDGTVGHDRTSPRNAQEVMVVAFGLLSGSWLEHFLCRILFVSGIDLYTHRKVFELLRVYFNYTIMGHRTCSVFSTPSI